MKRYLLFLCACTFVNAQNVSFDVEPRQLGINEAIKFSITIEGESSGRLPTFEPAIKLGDFELLQNHPSTSQSMKIINGQASSSITYTYVLRPTKKGSLLFPEQVIAYNGQKYKTPTVQVEVGEENLQVRRRPRDPFDMFEQGNRQQERTGEVFGTVEVPKKDFYLGEEIPLEVYIYMTPGLQLVFQESGVNLPDLSDFWVETVDLQPSEPEVVERKGKEYLRYLVYKKRLFANKAGELPISAADFQLTVAASGRMSLFSRASREQRRSDPFSLTIKPLPKQGQPANFSGLVGQFKMDAELDKQDLVVGDTVSLKVTLSGRGNSNVISELELQGLDPSFEVFKGGLPTTDVKDGITLAKTWAFALVPKHEGSYQIPIPQVTYFNPKTSTYQTTEVNPFELTVKPGEGLGSGAVVSNSARNDTLTLKENLRFIKMGELNEVPSENPPSPDTLLKFAAALVGANLLLYLCLLAKEKLAGRHAGRRPQMALRNFRKALTQLKTNDPADSYYAGLSAAVLSFFGDKWEREGQGISLEMIHDTFAKEGIPMNHYQEVAEVIEACDLARFTPSSPASRETLQQKARSVVESIEGVLK